MEGLPNLPKFNKQLNNLLHEEEKNGLFNIINHHLNNRLHKRKKKNGLLGIILDSIKVLLAAIFVSFGIQVPVNASNNQESVKPNFTAPIKRTNDASTKLWLLNQLISPINFVRSAMHYSHSSHYSHYSSSSHPSTPESTPTPPPS